MPLFHFGWYLLVFYMSFMFLCFSVLNKRYKRKSHFDTRQKRVFKTAFYASHSNDLDLTIVLNLKCFRNWYDCYRLLKIQQQQLWKYESELISYQSNLHPVEIHLFFIDVIATESDVHMSTVFRCHKPRTDKIMTSSCDRKWHPRISFIIFGNRK